MAMAKVNDVAEGTESKIEEITQPSTANEKVKELEGENRQLLRSFDEAEKRVKQEKEKASNVIEETESKIDKVIQLINTTNEQVDCKEKVKELDGENKQLSKSFNVAEERVKGELKRVNALNSEAEHLETLASVLHKKSSEANHEAGEATEKMFSRDDGCSSSLEEKDQIIEKLKKELEDCHSSLTRLKLQNDELSSKLNTMRSEFSEGGSGKQAEEREFSVAQLLDQLEMHKSSLATVKNDLEIERREKHTLEEELIKCKDLLDEYSESQLSLMEQTAELTDELQEVQVALERVDSELTERANEGSELELELQSWKLAAEHLRKKFEESQTIRRQLEATLLAQAHAMELPNKHARENDQKIKNLEQQIVLPNQDNMVTEEKEDSEKESKWSQIDGNDQHEVELLAGELHEAILAHIMKERKYTQLPIVLELMKSELSLSESSDQQIKEVESSVAHLMGQLEKRSPAKSRIDLENECQEKQALQALQEELNRYKEMLDESTECQLNIIEQAADTERQLIDELQEVQGVLETVDSQLTEETYERSELEFELYVWKSTAERLQMELEQSQAMRRRLESSLLALALEELPKLETAKEDLRINNLKQQSILLNQQMKIGEQDSTTEIEKAPKLLKIADGNEQEQELLARELEEAIVAHIMQERNCIQQPSTLNPMNIEFIDAGKEKELSVAYLMKQLEEKNDSLSKVQAQLKKECEEKLIIKEELNRCKEMLDEYSNSQLNAMQQAAEIEMRLTDELVEVHDVLDRVDSQLTDKTIERTQLEFELEAWKSIAERLNQEVEESQAMRKKLEASLLAQSEVDRLPGQGKDEEDQGITNVTRPKKDDKKELELLSEELEQAIVTHIMKERH